MGLHDAGCAVTGVAISENEPVLLVVVREPSIESPRDIFSQLYSSAHYRSIIGDMLPLLSDEMMVGLSEEAVAKSKELESKFKSLIDGGDELSGPISVKTGQYDGYGWIHGVDRPDDLLTACEHFFVKLGIATDIADRYAAKQNGDFDKKDLFDVLMAVTDFLDMCRINPYAKICGGQFFDEDEREAHRLHIKYIEQALGDQSERLDGLIAEV